MTCVIRVSNIADGKCLGGIRMEKYYRVYANVNLDAIVDNIKEIKKNISEDTQIIAVVKADGYGHGAIPVAKVLSDYVYGFAAATVDEAVMLRENGVDKPIIILGFCAYHEFANLISHDITATIFDYESARHLSEMAKTLDKVAKCHIKVDTGMHRIGFEPCEKSVKTIKRISKLPNLEMEGIFTHFATSDEADKSRALVQFDKFTSFIDTLAQNGIEFKLKHCSNSAAIIDMPQANLDLVRSGITTYGLYPSDEVNKDRVKLTPALELKSHVVMVKDVKKGEGISYNLTYVTDKVTKVATISIGYGDGYPRALSSKGYVLIRGKKANILGKVCMDQMMVDVTDIPDAAVNDEVTLIGRDGDEFISVEEIANLAGSFNYEFICGLGKRIPRNYYRSGKRIASKDYFHDTFSF